ncbi:ribosome-inactivating family protein [Streptomyces flaveolus]|uniref:ribosome-inactivating family protein n=1 Tax=Streptomyces flaveolus TaxID=67297 RepID=UPI003434C425
MVLLLSIFTVVLGANLTPASATTPNNSSRYVDLYLSQFDDPNGNQGRYNAAISQIRLAAGEEIRDNVWLSPGTALSAGLIELRLWDRDRPTPAHMLTLFINPQNLYIGGFQSRGGPMLFADASRNVRDEVARAHGPVYFLNMNGSYDSLGRAMGEGRDEPETMNIDALFGSAARLNGQYTSTVNNLENRANVATDMFRMIGAFAEAVRFPRFRDSFGAGLNRQTVTVINPFLQTLRNEWGHMSDWTRQFLNFPNNTQPRYFQGIGTLRGWSDVTNWLRMVNGRSTDQPV